jgi:hypothetical protein
VSPDKVEVRPTNPCPKEFTMTTSTMALAELAEKGADVDVLRQMVQFMAQRLMEIDVEGRVEHPRPSSAGSLPRRWNWAVVELSGLCELAPRRALAGPGNCW